MARGKSSSLRVKKTPARKSYEARKKHPCTHCDECFSCQFNVEQHIRAKHTHENPFECDQCDKKYNRAYCLNRHVKAAHGGKGTKASKSVTKARPRKAPKARSPTPDSEYDGEDSEMSDCYSDSGDDVDMGSDQEAVDDEDMDGSNAFLADVDDIVGTVETDMTGTAPIETTNNNKKTAQSYVDALIARTRPAVGDAVMDKLSGMHASDEEKLNALTVLTGMGAVDGGAHVYACQECGMQWPEANYLIEHQHSVHAIATGVTCPCNTCSALYRSGADASFRKQTELAEQRQVALDPALDVAVLATAPEYGLLSNEQDVMGMAEFDDSMLDISDEVLASFDIPDLDEMDLSNVGVGIGLYAPVGDEDMPMLTSSVDIAQ